MLRIFSLAFACLTSLAYANETQNRAMLDMMKNVSNQGVLGDGPAFYKCVGVSKDKIQSTFDQTAESCYSLHKGLASAQFAEQIVRCIEDKMPKTLGISRSKLEDCSEETSDTEDAFANSSFGQATAEMDSLLDQLSTLEEAGAPEAELAKVNARIEALQKKFESGEIAFDADGQDFNSDIATAMAVMSKASEDTLHLITLPIYPKHQVIAHVPTGGMIEIGENVATLPAATFYSTDSLEALVSFYANKLPGFEKKVLPQGEVIFMKGLPKNFDMLRHLKDYTTKPHVFIRPASSSDAGAGAGTKSFFEIAYTLKK